MSDKILLCITKLVSVSQGVIRHIIIYCKFKWWYRVTFGKRFGTKDSIQSIFQKIKSFTNIKVTEEDLNLIYENIVVLSFVVS